MNVFRRVHTKIGEVGFINALIGIGGMLYYEVLRKRFHFDNWHTSPIYLRKYALDIVKWCNQPEVSCGCIVEVGCGLGEIVRRLNGQEMFGYDIEENVICAAQYLDKDCKVQHRVGTFTDINCQDPIDILIAVNFTHMMDKESVREAFAGLTRENDIRYIIVDGVKEYQNYHNYANEQILPFEFVLCKTLGPYKREREVFIFEKKLPSETG